jgi:hypothetical protein
MEPRRAISVKDGQEKVIYEKPSSSVATISKKLGNFEFDWHTVASRLHARLSVHTNLYNRVKANPSSTKITKRRSKGVFGSQAIQSHRTQSNPRRRPREKSTPIWLHDSNTRGYGYIRPSKQSGRRCFVGQPFRDFTNPDFHNNEDDATSSFVTEVLQRKRKKNNWIVTKRTMTMLRRPARSYAPMAKKT